MKARPLFWLPLLIGVLLVGYALSRSQEPAKPQRFRHNFIVMGTAATVLVDWPAHRSERFVVLMHELEGRVRRVEKLMSRFDPESDVSRFNRAPAGEMLAVNPLTWTALTEAMRVYTLSQGAFDVTVLPLMKLYDWKNKEAQRFPEAAAVTAAQTRVGMDKLLWQREGMKIGKKVDGVELDLGGVAKGLGVDVAADFLLQNGVKNAVVDIGGEQRLLGQASRRDESVEQYLGTTEAERVAAKTPAERQSSTSATKSGGRPWIAGIRDPRAAENNGAGDKIPGDAAGGVPAQVLRIHRDCALATSGDYEKYFMWQGQRYSHILDPRSGRPLSGGVVSATIVYPGACMTADALATAASVLGVEDTRQMLQNFPTAAAWLIDDDQQQTHIPAVAPEKIATPE